jgi:hypothetical protein
MIYSISGAQMCGKTSVIRGLKDYSERNGLGWIFPTVDYRSLIKEKGLPLNKEANFLSQKAILDFMSEQERYYQGYDFRFKTVIFDRSTYDCDVYSYSSYMSGGMIASEFETLRSQYELLVSNPSYSIQRLILGFDPKTETVEREGRECDREYVLRINRLMREMFLVLRHRENNSKNYLVLPEDGYDSASKKLEFCLDKIKSFS